MNSEFLPDKNIGLLHNQAEALRTLLLHRQLWAIVIILILLSIFGFWTYYWMLIRPGELRDSSADLKPKQNLGKWGMLLPVILVQLSLISVTTYQLISFFENFQSVSSMAQVAPYVPLIKYYLVTENAQKRISKMELNREGDGIMPSGYAVSENEINKLSPNTQTQKHLASAASKEINSMIESLHPVRNRYLWKFVFHGILVMLILEAFAVFLFLMLRYRMEEGE